MIVNLAVFGITEKVGGGTDVGISVWTFSGKNNGREKTNPESGAWTDKRGSGREI